MFHGSDLCGEHLPDPLCAPHSKTYIKLKSRDLGVHAMDSLLPINLPGKVLSRNFGKLEL
jgi:hypothetical protein